MPGDYRLPSGVPSEFASAYYKVCRAGDHMAVLQPEIEAWRDGNGYELVTDRDPKTGQKTVRFRCQGFPLWWGPMIGDILQGLRNSLDNAIYGIAAASGQLTTDDAEHISFPVMGTKPLTAAKAERTMKHVPVSVREAVKAMQPHLHADYKKSVLWVLHRLANIDKHRTVHLVACVNQGFRALAPDGMDRVPAQRLWTSAAGARLEDDTVVAEYLPFVGAEGPEADVKIELSPEVVFQEPDLVELPVLAVLDTSAREVVTMTRAIIGQYVNPLLPGV